MTSAALKLGLTPAHSCDYLPEQQARSLVVIDEQALSPRVYETLLESGFRRSSDHAYRPWCDACRACVAERIPVDHFRPNRSQRRTRRSNRDLSLSWREAILSDEQYRLYQRYQQARHPGGSMARSSQEETAAFLFARWSDCRVLELRLGSELLAVAVTDIQPSSLSAVYTFFHPGQSRRSLGSAAIMAQIEHAVDLGKRWLYLGYWIDACPKMHYKADYLPLEVRRAERVMSRERWLRIDTPEERSAFLRKMTAWRRELVDDAGQK